MYALIVALLEPFTFFCLLSAAALANFWRKRRETRRRLLWLTLLFALMVFFSTGTATFILSAPLELHYPPAPQRPPDADVIIVLGGYVTPATKYQPRPRLGQDSLRRCLHAADLYHQGKRCRILVTGGNVERDQSAPRVARYMGEVLVSLGVSAADIIVEDNSRTTYENAVECRKVLEAQRLGKAVLVTDARHMVRALRCFQQQGVEVVPSGCHYQNISLGGTPLYDFLPNGEAARNTGQAVHEWVGVIWYWLRGWI